MKTKKVSLCHSIKTPLCTVAFLTICSIASAQNLFVGSYGSQNIAEIPSGGGSASVFASGLTYPTGFAFDSSGDLFAADQLGGEIYEYVNSGGTLSSTPVTIASGLDQPNIMAFNSTGSLFVDINGTSIEKFTGSSGSIYLSGLSGASGLAFDKAGNLFVAFINGGGSTSGYINEYFAGGGQTTYASGLDYPIGIAFDASGDLFTADGPAGTITKITPGKTESIVASGLDAPTEIAFDNAGDMFVTDQGVNQDNGDITEFTTTDQKIVYNTTISKPAALAFQGVALPVPEPSTLGLLGAGVLTLAARYRNKKLNR